MNNSKDDPKIVVVGGGTGLSVLLKGLKRYTDQLTAIVTVSDDGGSSGRLRAEMGILPPGDIRNCLVALAETETLMDRVFQHRFEQGEGIKGHNLGNLLMVAMAEITGDFVSAIKEVSKVLAVRGQVIPATLESVNLGAEMSDGAIVVGETAIRQHRENIARLFLIPEKCLPIQASIDAIKAADAIVIGPGSLYTSIIPNLLVEGVSEAMMQSPAVKIYVSNIMTEQGETDDFTALDHIRTILHYARHPIIDYAVLNTGVIDDLRLDRYRQEKAAPVDAYYQQILDMGIKVAAEDLVGEDDVAWHDTHKLAQTIIGIIRSEQQKLPGRAANENANAIYYASNGGQSEFCE
ncbi:MAG TPA: gluconeogenesis factor YvcK family protein [Syntrophomonas sp.]|nr:gluconeogenesis factor YvcK family protein [Syntrophomonas sp.]